MKDGRRMNALSSVALRRMGLFCLIASFFILPAFPSGSHEAFKVTEKGEFRGSDVFTIQEDGSLPFLGGDQYFVPAMEPGYEGKNKVEISSKGVRDGQKIIYTLHDFEPEEKASEESILLDWHDMESGDTMAEDDLWDDGGDLWGEEDSLWEDDGDIWGDEDLWGTEDPWGDDFWEEDWEPAGVNEEGLMEDDPEFWSDFYIAGSENSMTLEDGSYYMDLWINDSFVGNVEITSEDGVGAISAEAFKYVTSDKVTEEEKIFYESFADTIPFPDLEARGYVISTDSIEYVVTITIPTHALDTVVLSIAQGGPRMSGLLSTRPLANAIEVKPAVFTMETNWALSMYVPLWPEFDPWSLLSYDISMSNRLRLFDVYSQFSLGLSVGRSMFDFRFGIYSFYTDFPDEGLRLSWGNISGYGKTAKGTPLGIKLERNASFYDSSWRRQSYVSQELVLETKSDVTVTNGGAEIFHSTLEMGTYRLEDFVLSAGGNDVKIIIEPLDGSPTRVIDFSVLYGYSLLAPGENWWGVSLMTGREEKNSKAVSPFALSVPWLNDTYLEYDVRNISLGFFFDVGLVRGLTMRTRGSFTNAPTDTVDFSPAVRFDLSLVNTNDLGNISFTAAYWNTTKDGSFFSNNASLGYSQSFTTGWKPISSISFSLGYDYTGAPVFNTDDHLGRGSLSMGGRLGFLNWSASGSGSINFLDPIKRTLSLSSSFSFAAGRNVSVSSSLSMSLSPDRAPVTAFRVGISMYLGDVSSSLSGDASGNIDLRLSGGKGSHSGSGSISTNWNNQWSTGLSGFYSYSGKYVNLGAGINTGIDWFDREGAFSPEAKATGISLNVSTSSLFADGLIQFRASVPHNYLMIKQKGALKKNVLTTATGNSSSETELFSQFGVSTIDGITGMRDDWLTLYSQSSDGENYHSYNIKIPASQRTGYVLTLEEDYRYVVSGLVPGWYNASSPIYTVHTGVDEEGREYMALGSTDLYLFSDETTRFLSPALLPGKYAFDVPVGDGTFRLTVFEVPDLEGKGGVIMLDDIEPLPSLYLNTAYSVYEEYTTYETVTTDEYWEILYPTDAEDDDWFGSDEWSDDGFWEDDDSSFWGDDDLWGDEDGLWEDGSAEPSEGSSAMNPYEGIGDMEEAVQ